MASTNPPRPLHFNCRAACVLTALVLLLADSSYANPFSVLGYDGASMGKGGALTANASGPAAVYYNPAGLARPINSHTVLSYLHGEPLMKLKVMDNPDLLDFAGFEPKTDAQIDTACGTLSADDNCVMDYRRYNDYLLRAAGIGGSNGESGVRGAYERINTELIERAENPKRLNGVTLGFSSPLTNAGGAALAIGGSVFLPLDAIAHQRLRGPTTPYFLQYDDAPHRIAVDLGGAIMLYDALRLGVGVDILVDINASIDVAALLPAELRLGSVLTPDPNVADINVVVKGDIDVPLKWGFVAGAQYNLGEDLDVGFTFRDKQQIDLDVDTVIVLESPFGRQEIPVSIKSQARFQPRELAGGLAWRINDEWQIMADLTWKQWSQFKPEIAIEADISTTGLSAGVCDLVETFSDLQDILDIAGDVVNLGPDEICPFIEDQVAELGLDDLSVYDVSKNRLKNTFNPALGISYNGSPWAASVGYRFEANPATKQDGLFSIIDANTHVYGANLDFKLFSFVTLGVYAQYRQLQKTTIHKSAARVESQSNNADAFPDLDSDPANGPGAEFNTSDAELERLVNYVDGVQSLAAGYPGYTVSGGYLSTGLQLTVYFDPPTIGVSN